MKSEQEFVFPPFRLDCVNECLWREARQIPLRGKTFAVLRCLLESCGQLVTKAVLFTAVWPDTYVNEGALTICIAELRKALGDNSKTPRFIETVHRRGYRFIAPLTTAQPVPRSGFQVPRSDTRDSALRTQPSVLVGRKTELQQLQGWWEKALDGERQIVFVSGEAGIGKTSLIDAFLSEIQDPRLQEENQKARGKNQNAKVENQFSTPSPQPLAPGVWIARGQCIEHYGAGEGYMPVLEALGRLCREAEGARFIEFLHHHAPTWLVQMPALLTAADLEALQRRVAGATRERMLREMAEALEALTATRPLVLQLEDLHWSDVSTLELLSVLARRREAARLLVLGTYRPVEMLANGHPLRTVRQELQLHRHCEEQRLAFLTEEHVAEYLGHRFAGGAHDRAPLQTLARLIHRRTEGNPLFMVNVVDYLAAQGGLEEAAGQVQVGVPSNLQQMIEEQLHRLSAAERRVLEAASVAGVEFSAATVAVSMETEVEAIEEQCEKLVRREQFLRASGTAGWPDGTVAGRYGFLHALYQEVLYQRLTISQRQRLHRQIGEKLERAYGLRAREIAAELAMHFERGREYRKAVQYLQQAGKNAAQRTAYTEAVHHLSKGLALLKTLPDTPERAQLELTLQLALGPLLQVTKGLAAPEVERVYTRARALCQQIGETPQLFSVLQGLEPFYFVRGELKTARELAEQYLSLAQRLQNPHALAIAHILLGRNYYEIGEAASALTHEEQGLALYNPHVSSSMDLRLAGLQYAAFALWNLGYPDQALKRGQEALTLAQESSHPFGLTHALQTVALLYQFRREEQKANEYAETVMTLCTEQGFPQFLAYATCVRGWALAAQGQGEEGVAQMRQGLAAIRATGAENGRPYYLCHLAKAYGKVGQTEEGLALVVEALAQVHKMGAHYTEAELYRVKGELLLAQKGSRLQAVGHREKTEEAEACFHKAIEIARQQQAKSLELRATVSLARLWQSQGKRKEAHELLAEIYHWFTEGFDTKDLQEVKTLLRGLS